MVRNWFRKIGLSRDRKPSQAGPQPPSLPFADVESALALYVKALSDNRLKVMSSSLARQGSYSDGRTIFVPPEVNYFQTLQQAKRFYRIASAWKVMQVRSGSIDIERVPDPVQNREVFLLYEILSGEWLDRTLVSTWPGLAPELTILRRDALRRREKNGSPAGNGVESLLQALLTFPLDRSPLEADISLAAGTAAAQNGILIDMLRATGDMLLSDRPDESLKLAKEFSNGNGSEPETISTVHYRGKIRPDLLKPPLIDIEDISPDQQEHRPGNRRRPPPRSEPIQVESRHPNPLRDRKRRNPIGGRQSVQLSLADREPARTFHQVPLSEQEKVGAHLYNEWDYLRGMYLPEWCALRNRRPKGGNADKIEQILRQHAPLVRYIKQQFEALRPERLRLNRQLDGDDIDLAALVDAHSDHRAGISPTEKLYSRVLEKERNIAVACLIDQSGSTGAWIDDDPRNDQVVEVTRRAVVFLCEALSVLDDRHAIYGFTGSTRKHCEFSIYKAFDESYGETVKGRIAGFSPGSYTRMGPAIRHAARNLVHQAARVRILMLLTDGRPNDFDGYGGRYGLEDTRRALIEARQMGVKTFALTIDAEARDYMPYTFGHGQYIVVEDTASLAVKLSDVYRRLTVQ